MTKQLTPRERFLAALGHKEADRVPIHDSPWGSTVDRWRTEGLPSGVSPSDYFGYGMTGFGADTSPQFPVEVIKEDREYIVERDSFGGIRRNHRDRSTTPEVIDWPCKSRADWEKLKTRLEPSDRRVDWVSTLNNYHYEKSRNRFITYSAGVGFDKMQSYVATPKLLRAIVLEPDWVTDMYWTDAKLTMRMYDRLVDAGLKFDGAFMYCDLGYKNGVFFSPKHYEEQLHPVFKELVRFFHGRDLPVLLHSCGRVLDYVPFFVEEGIDCLQPLEVKAGMDVIALKEKYGDKLAFMGGIDVRLMALDDPRPVEEEIKKKFRIAKEGGGYIYHSDHSVPKDVSFKNYQRVMELVRKYGTYN